MRLSSLCQGNPICKLLHSACVRLVSHMLEYTIRQAEKSLLAGGCFGACFGPPEIPINHPTVLRITQTKKEADSLNVRKLVMRLHGKKVKKLVAGMAEEASGQSSWKEFFPDPRCPHILGST